MHIPTMFSPADIISGILHELVYHQDCKHIKLYINPPLFYRIEVDTVNLRGFSSHYVTDDNNLIKRSEIEYTFLPDLPCRNITHTQFPEVWKTLTHLSARVDLLQNNNNTYIGLVISNGRLLTSATGLTYSGRLFTRPIEISEESVVAGYTGNERKTYISFELHTLGETDPSKIINEVRRVVNVMGQQHNKKIELVQSYVNNTRMFVGSYTNNR